MREPVTDNLRSTVLSSVLSSSKSSMQNWMQNPLSATVIGALRFYKRWISPLLPSACRFRPTCSEYMMQAVEKHGVAKGTWMGLKRLARCQPLCQGGFDPVR